MTSNNTEMSNKEKELAIIEMQEMGNNNGPRGSLDSLPKYDETKTKKTVWQMTKTVLNIVFRVIAVLVCLYVFIIALDLMSTGFRICLGLQISQLFRQEAILQSPITGLVIGVLVTVVVQSSSASTSIVVSLVASGTIPEVKYAIPIIMGANIGTSVTSTLVALTQAKEKKNFGRAFAGGTVHDAFNLLSVFVLLPLEVATGYLEHLSGAMTSSLGNSSTVDSSSFDVFDHIKKPVVNAIIQIDKTLMDKYADKDYVITHNETFLKTTCSYKYENGTSYKAKCKYFFGSDLFEDWSENTIGIVLTIVSLAIVIGALIMISKVLSSIFSGPVAKAIQKIINAEPKHCITRHLIGYFSIAIGCVLTMILQSSSVFTSSLVPLVGMGIVSLERVFPLTLGSNIGTTFTGVLAALGQSTNFQESIQIAICHTFFNISGIVVWYPIPFLRQAPLAIARYLGERSAQHRWFAIAYLVVLFLITPAILLGLAIISETVLYIVFGVFVVICLLLVAFHIVQKKFPNRLPEKLRTWEFLPKPVFNVLCKVDEEQEELNGAESGDSNVKSSQPPRIGSSKVTPVQENFYSQVKPSQSGAQVKVVNEANKIGSDDEAEMNF